MAGFIGCEQCGRTAPTREAGRWFRVERVDGLATFDYAGKRTDPLAGDFCSAECLREAASVEAERAAEARAYFAVGERGRELLDPAAAS